MKVNVSTRLFYFCCSGSNGFACFVSSGSVWSGKPASVRRVPFQSALLVFACY